MYYFLCSEMNIELGRLEPRAAVFVRHDDRSGQAGADGTGFGDGLAVSQADCDAGEEGISGPGGVDDIHFLRRADPADTVGFGINRALVAHGDDHARDAGLDDLAVQDLTELLRGFAGEVLREVQAGFLVIADNTAGLLQQVTAFHGNRHIGDNSIDLLAVLGCEPEDLLQNGRLHIDFHDDAVGFPDDLITVFIQNIPDGGKIRPFGNRSDNITHVVEDGQPGAQPVLAADNVVRVDLVPLQLVDDIRADARMIHHADKGRPQFHIGDILRHIAAYPAIDLHDPSDIAAGRNILRQGIPFDINKYCPENNNTHKCHISL